MDSTPEEGSDDKEQVLSPLMRLEGQKKAMTKKLEQLKIDNKNLKEDIERTKTETSAAEEDLKAENRNINRLKEKSSTLQQNIERLEDNINENRIFVERLRQESAQRRSQRMDAIEQMSSDLMELSKRFTELNVKCKSSEKRDSSEMVSLAQIEEEINRLSEKRSSLIEELEKRKVSPKEKGPKPVITYYPWMDWPIGHRMMATNEFLAENEMLQKDMETITKIKEESEALKSSE